MGGELIAISTDPIQRLIDGRPNYPDLPCILTSDADNRAIQTLGLVQKTPGKAVAAPANILIRADGTVAWTHYASIVMDRPDSKNVAAAVDAL